MGAFVGRIGRGRLAATGGAVAALIAAVVIVFAASGGGGNESAASGPGPGDTPAATATRTSEPSPTIEPSPTPIAHAGILDGVAMSDAEWSARKDLLPLAVMVDNTAAAYPHAGLNKADVVYEAFVEGGITRLMAVYWRQDAEKILPVRSARTPFVTWASELGAMYGHAGGASTENDANAIGQIFEWGIKDLNAFSDISNEYYYRDGERFGPVDLATSTAYLREAAERLGFAGPPAVESWKFREPGTQLPAGEPARGIEVKFGNIYPWQAIQWKWDPAKGRYLRYQFGGPQRDALSDEQLAFATVIVMKVPSSVVDDVGHVVLEQLGSGEATVFTGGKAYAGTWKKEKRESRTRFYDAKGEEIVFERGPIFIESIAEQSRFSYAADETSLPPLPEYTPPPPGTRPEGPAEPEEAPTATPAETPTLAPTAAPSPTATPTPGTPTATPTPAPTATPTIDPTL
jgi:hypothetical protein